MTQWHRCMTVWHRHNDMTWWHTHDRSTWHDDTASRWVGEEEGGEEGGAIRGNMGEISMYVCDMNINVKIKTWGANEWNEGVLGKVECVLVLGFGWGEGGLCNPPIYAM